MAHRSDTVTGRFESLEEIQETKGLIDDLKALISPARALIPEVVSTIFEFCVSTQGKLPTPNPSKAPLLLIQISADWRRIALATPKVYSSLFMYRNPIDYFPDLAIYPSSTRHQQRCHSVGPKDRKANPHTTELAPALRYCSYILPYQILGSWPLVFQ